MKPKQFRRNGTRVRTPELDKKVVDILLGEVNKGVRFDGNLQVIAYNRRANKIMVLDDIIRVDVATDEYSQFVSYASDDVFRRVMCSVSFKTEGFADVVIPKYREFHDFAIQA